MNPEPLLVAEADFYPVQRGRRFSIRIEFDRALAEDTEVALQFEALDGSDDFEIGHHQRLSLGMHEYRVHGAALGEPGVYRLSRLTLNHPALAPRVYETLPDVRLTIVEDPPTFPELVSAERYISQADLHRAY